MGTRENLLLGNGINIKFARDVYNAGAIRERFMRVLLESSCLYEELLSIKLDSDTLQNMDTVPEGSGIETLAGHLYKLIEKKLYSSGTVLSENIKKRINAAIKISALTAIFFDNSHFLKVAISPAAIAKLRMFDTVFSLNYYEFWQPNNCKYLHGNLTSLLSSIPCISEKPVLLYDDSRYNAYINHPIQSNYHFTVERLRNKHSMYSVKGEDNILFSSPVIDKTYIASLYPSDNLYPDWDSFPARSYNDNYSALEKLDNLAVFGVSPYGDNRLIGSIKQVKKLSIYIHKLHNSCDEVANWSRLLSDNNHHNDVTFYDSECFWR